MLLRMQKPAFKNIFCLACRIRLGEAEAFFARANVKDTETRGYRIFMEFGLLTESELEGLTGKKPQARQVPGFSMQSQTGSLQQMFLVTLDGLSCCQIHSMRRIEMYTSNALSQEELLLEAARQLHKEHAANVFEFNYAGLLKKNPVGLRDATGYRQHVKSVEQLRSAELEAMIAVVPQEEPISVDDDQPATHTSRRLQAEPKKRRRRKGGEGTQSPARSDAASAAASAAAASGSRPGSQLAAAVAKVEIKSEGGRVYQVGGRRASSGLDSDAMDPTLEEAALQMRSMPHCFKKLTIPRILQGDKLGNQINGARAPVAGICFRSGHRWGTQQHCN